MPDWIAWNAMKRIVFRLWAVLGSVASSSFFFFLVFFAFSGSSFPFDS